MDSSPDRGDVRRGTEVKITDFMRVPALVALSLFIAGGAAGSQPAGFAGDKIQPSAYRAAVQHSTAVPVSVFFREGVSFEEAREAILAAGGALDDVFATAIGPMRELRAKIASPSLDALAADERVLMITGPRHFRLTTHNAVSAQVSHV